MKRTVLEKYNLINRWGKNNTETNGTLNNEWIYNILALVHYIVVTMT